MSETKDKAIDQQRDAEFPPMPLLENWRAGQFGLGLEGNVYGHPEFPDGEIYAKCAKAWPLWQHVVMFPILPLGCAERFPQHNVCIIWLGETSTDGVEEHERAHCAGYSH